MMSNNQDTVFPLQRSVAAPNIAKLHRCGRRRSCKKCPGAPFDADSAAICRMSQLFLRLRVLTSPRRTRNAYLDNIAETPGGFPPSSKPTSRRSRRFFIAEIRPPPAETGPSDRGLLLHARELVPAR